MHFSKQFILSLTVATIAYAIPAPTSNPDYEVLVKHEAPFDKRGQQYIQNIYVDYETWNGWKPTIALIDYAEIASNSAPSSNTGPVYASLINGWNGWIREDINRGHGGR